MRPAPLLILLVVGLTSCSASRKLRRPDLDNLQARFSLFNRNDTAADYRITLCADVPNDKDPSDVFYKGEPGHVFLVMSQNNKITQVFGYYPVRPASTVFFRNVRSVIRDNSGREYDVQVSARIDSATFYSIIDSAVVFARKKYNLNKYNCYDYAVKLFNLAAGQNSIPVLHVRFPFIAGKGGSPCALYKQLRAMKESSGFWAPNIIFGVLKAPG